MPFKSEAQQKKPPLRACKYCPNEAKKNIINGRNKGWLRTCGNQKCLTMQYKLSSVSLKKIKICIRKCGLCKEDYKAIATQKWCKKCVPDIAARRRAQRYNISHPEWSELLLLQGGTCALCENTPTCVDHCHEHGHVRGLVCSSCNFLLGVVDRPRFIEKALRYIQEAKNANQVASSA